MKINKNVVKTSHISELLQILYVAEATSCKSKWCSPNHQHLSTCFLFEMIYIFLCTRSQEGRERRIISILLLTSLIHDTCNLTISHLPQEPFHLHSIQSNTKIPYLLYGPTLHHASNCLPTLRNVRHIPFARITDQLWFLDG